MIIQKIYREFVGLYLSNLSLPMVFKPSSKATVIFILTMIIFTILFNLGLYKNFNSSITYMLVCGSIFNLFFLKFNFIVRFYNVFYKSIHYFYNLYKNAGSTNKFKIKVVIFYYSYNIVCFILAYLIVVRIQYNLFEFNYSIGEYTQIYSYVLSPVLSLMFIDYISEDKVLYKQVLLDKLGKIIHLIIIGLIIWSLLAVITNLVLLKPILCDTTGSENNQVNQNTQNGDHATNEQSNGNNQITHLDNNSSSSSSRIYNTRPRQFVQTNSQGNVNNQVFKGKTPNVGLYLMEDSDEDGDLIQDNKQVNFNNQIKISKNIMLKIETDLTNPDVKFVTDTVSGHNSTKKLIANTGIVSKKVNTLDKFCSVSESTENNMISLRSDFDIRRFSFMEAFEALRDLKDYNFINEIQFKNNLYYLLNYAAQQDVNNNLLTFYTKELLDNPNNINNLLHNKLIYMNGKYSIIVVDNEFDTYVTLNYRSDNLAQLQVSNIKYKNELLKHFENLKFKNVMIRFNETSNEIISVEIKIRACDKLNEFLVTNYRSQIENIYLNSEAAGSMLSKLNTGSYFHTPQNKLYYWNNLGLFTFEFNKEYYVISANSRIKLFNCAYLDYLKAKQNSIFFGDHNILYYDALLEAIAKNIPSLDVRSSDNQIATQMVQPLNRFNIFNFDRLERDFPTYQPSIREREVTSRFSDSSHNQANNANNVERTDSNISLYNSFRKAVYNIFRGRS